MLVSTRSRYGLRAMVEMVHLGWTEPVSLSRLALAEEVSQRYLEQIFMKLRAAGIVKGRRGPRGGYVLSRPPSEITLLDIIYTLEIGFLAPECAGDAPNCPGSRAKGRVPCGRIENCATRGLWVELRKCCLDYLGSHTLSDLVNGNLSEG